MRMPSMKANFGYFQWQKYGFLLYRKRRSGGSGAGNCPAGKNNLPRYYKTPWNHIQVLTPMQKGIVGAANLNLALQEALNPQGDGLRRGGYLFRTGDKVMQIRNNYEKEIFNGDIGTVESVDLQERTLKVNFDQHIIEYEASELDELVHAYATTIHKAQGSEYPIVVMPVLMNHYVMLQRNLIYTGITRAKRFWLS